MKAKLLMAALIAMGSASAAQAAKVAEYGDPVIGNSYGGCSFRTTYGTGGAGYRYYEWTVTCPSGGPYVIGVYHQIYDTPYSYREECSFSTNDSSYYASGNCDNWRVYTVD